MCFINHFIYKEFINMSEIFDPSEQETKELVPEVKSAMSDYTEDTNADPEGAEQRAVKASIHMPDWWHKKFRLTDDGKPTFNPTVVNGVMNVFKEKFGTKPFFADIDLGNGKTLTVDQQQVKWDEQVNTIVQGFRVLLGVDPQSTGLNVLQLTTRTWSEFCSVSYEYQESMSAIKDDEIPDWLLEREQKMLDLGRKARMLTQAIGALDNEFGLKDTVIQEYRVRTAVEQRMQRLAEWNFKQQADASGKVERELNAQTTSHMRDILNNA